MPRAKKTSKSVLAAVREYGVHRRLMAVRVPEESLLAGHRLAESRLGTAFDLTVLGMIHEGETSLSQDPEEPLRPGDTLLVQGSPEDLQTLQGLQELRVDEGETGLPEIESADVGLVEVMLAPGSRLADCSLRELRFRERYGVSVVAIWSEGHAYRSELGDRPIGLGDVLLVHGPRERMSLLRDDPNFLLLAPSEAAVVEERKAPLAAAIMAGVVTAVMVGWLPIFIAAPAGAALMVLTGCLPVDQLYRNVDWRAIVLIGGMLSLGLAMERTGAASLLADLLLGSVAGFGAVAVLAALFWLTALTAQVMPTTAVAVILAPIALSAASDLGLSPQSLMMVVAVGASSAFLSPVGHPVNLMVMGLGGYRFGDYARAGVPLVLINFLLALLVVPLLLPPLG